MLDTPSPAESVRLARSARDVSVWKWLNSLSLDAVAVGTLWVAAFTIEFCQRAPEVYEVSIIGLSIWIAYTADRLLDSNRLDESQPHTFRHEIHLKYRAPLAAIWVAAIALATLITVRYAEDRQLRWGIVAISAVVCYVLLAQKRRTDQRALPKELLAGLLFAFGASLPAWAETTDQVSHSLINTTIAVGLLFAGNCVTIAIIERDLDSSQGMDSVAIRYPHVSQWLPWMFVVHALICAVLLCAGLLPESIGVSIIASDAALSGLAFWIRRNDCVCSANMQTEHRLALADAALVVPLMIGPLFASTFG